LSHAQICSGLLENWGFKKSLVTAIRLQYAPEDASSHLVSALYAANLISKKLLPIEPVLTVSDLPACVQLSLGGNFSTVYNAMGDLAAIVDDAKKNAGM
jgi:HD-like signal output (HDOD) protein